MEELLKRTPLEFIRYKYDEINWDSRLIGIVGPRGVGKSTMILQRIKQAKDEPMPPDMMLACCKRSSKASRATLENTKRPS